MESEKRECQSCHIVKDSVQDFHAYRRLHCKKCHSDQSQVSKKKALQRKNLLPERLCSNCKQIKSSSEFYKNTQTNHCKKCHTGFVSAKAKSTREEYRILKQENKELLEKRIQDLEENKTLKQENQELLEKRVQDLEEQLRLIKLSHNGNE